MLSGHRTPTSTPTSTPQITPIPPPSINKHPFSFISFNINGLVSPNSRFKIKYLKNIISLCRAQIVLLQETHCLPLSPSAHLLSSYLPHFSWFFSDLPLSGWGGNAIGIRKSFISPFSTVFQSFPPSSSSLLLSFIGRQGQPITVISSYRQKNDSSFTSTLQETLISNQGTLIWGGDLNANPHTPIFAEVSSSLLLNNSCTLVPESPSYFSGTTIDYVAIPATWTRANFSLCLPPPPLKDHSPLLFCPIKSSSFSPHPTPRINHKIFLSSHFSSLLKLKLSSPCAPMEEILSLSYNTAASLSCAPPQNLLSCGQNFLSPSFRRDHGTLNPSASLQVSSLLLMT